MKQEVTVDGLKININIEESGNGDTTLLMVHGIPTLATCAGKTPSISHLGNGYGGLWPV